MGEPGGLLSMGLHRVRHDGSDLVAAAAELCYVIPMALVQTDLGQAWPTGGSK